MTASEQEDIKADDENEVVDATEIVRDNNAKLITSRVNIEPSPEFNVKMNTTMVTMIMDTGATGSMINVFFVVFLCIFVQRR